MMAREFTNYHLIEMLTLKIYIKNESLLGNGDVLRLFEELSEYLFDNHNIAQDPQLLTPSNIVLDDNGHMLRIDADNGMENPHYRAPEVLRGADDSFQSFIYNLGAVFYFIATRKTPYGVYREGAEPDAHLERRLIEPDSLNKNLSPELGAMIRKMMSLGPSMRHNSIAAFRMDVKKIKHGEWPLNAPVPLGVHADKSPRRKLAPAMEIGRRPAARKKVAVSDAKIAKARKKQRKSLRRSGKGPIYLLLLAAGIWAAWYFNVEEYIADFDIVDRLKSVTAKKNELPSHESERIDTESDALPLGNENDSKRDYPDEAVSDIEEKYSRLRKEQIRRQRDESKRRNSGRSKAKWKDPEFIAGARLYNRAIDRLDDYTASVRAGNPNPRMLDGIEDTLQQAAACFKSCRSRAPEHVPIKKYIDNCYKMIAKCRQSKLLDLSR